MECSGETQRKFSKNVSLLKFVRSEITSSYIPEQHEDRYEFKREKIYSFFTVPREVEKFLGYGFFQVLDAFLFVFTFLPLRSLSALFTLLSQFTLSMLGARASRGPRWLEPSQLVDLMKAFIIVANYHALSYLDTSMLYHVVKSQSIIKLYMFYNMLEVGDKLLSSFGQDTLDSLQWTAAELRVRKRHYLTPTPHMLLASVYVFLHCILILFQVTVLNVAMNSNNKSLLAVMMSNNFVELKGSVFKKFDKNNLLQVSCSDIRERFQYVLLLFLVFIQTLKEFGWSEDQLWVLLPDGVLILLTEVLVDWVKHAFITRFNEIPLDVYAEYTHTLARDLISSKRKLAFSDHSDMVSHRMGFIPLPVAALTARIVAQSVTVRRKSDWLIVAVGYVALCSFRLLNTLLILGKATTLLSNTSATTTAGTGTASLPMVAGNGGVLLSTATPPPATPAESFSSAVRAAGGGRLSTPCRLRSRQASGVSAVATAAAAAAVAHSLAATPTLTNSASANNVVTQSQPGGASVIDDMAATSFEPYNVFREFSQPQTLSAEKVLSQAIAAAASAAVAVTSGVDEVCGCLEIDTIYSGQLSSNDVVDGDGDGGDFYTRSSSELGGFGVVDNTGALGSMPILDGSYQHSGCSAGGDSRHGVRRSSWPSLTNENSRCSDAENRPSLRSVRADLCSKFHRSLSLYDRS